MRRTETKRPRPHRARIWSDEQLVSAVATSQTLSQVVKKLGLKSVSSGYGTVRRHIKRLGLDTAGFVGRKVSGNRTKGRFNQVDLAFVLVEDSPYISTHWLKLRLVKAGLLDWKCCICGIAEWLGSKLSLQLDHKNGRREDNRIENLRLLCPNCHSQTDTYAGKNKRA